MVLAELPMTLTQPEGMGTFFNPNGIMFRGVWRQGVFESAENPRGLPVCLVEGSSYQLQGEPSLPGYS